MELFKLSKMCIPIEVPHGPPIHVLWHGIGALPSLLQCDVQEPLPADGCDIMEDGTGHHDIAGTFWSNPQVFQTLEPVGIGAKRHLKL